MKIVKQETMTDRIEELFLRIFKIVILVIMGLGLVLAIGFSIYAAALYFQSPNKPLPVKQAPPQDVNVDKLLNQLKPEEPTKTEEKSSPPEPAKASSPQTLRYMEDVTALYRCSVEFGKAVGATVDEIDSTAASRTIEEYRSQLEQQADSKDYRGPAYVKDAVKFSCIALKNPQIITLRKEGKVSGVFVKVLNFHLKEWDRIQLEIAKFNREENLRIDKHNAEEEARVVSSKIQAVTMIAIAGVAFAIFMIIALYLIFAKIETNLRRLANKDESLSKLSSD